MSIKEHWKVEPDEHDYPAAHDYLSLVAAEATAKALVEALKAAPITIRKAKDLLRASGLPVLPDSNVHVVRDLEKVRRGEHLSPILLVRGNFTGGAPLVIADGYHRICASYHVDEDADVAWRLVSAP